MAFNLVVKMRASAIKLNDTYMQNNISNDNLCINIVNYIHNLSMKQGSLFCFVMLKSFKP
jgi:hypothetical protein